MAGNEWLHPTDCQLLSIEKYMSYRGVGGCVSMMFSILSGNEKSNTGQSDRSNRMTWGFLLARAVILATHDGLADRIELILPGRFSFGSLRKTFGHLSDTFKKSSENFSS